ncbi:hypothetical protein ETD86_29005 [Nonomuraea turkmeniaca]|uniref:Uncharacterized protein n=1 Tax=Nonomuraea turkmeniaca TaxID=103838 RepID=A0A5S4FAM9_9ACTN|nr:hypothetical protein ETD86_29005 [Nonomuraea turkmeniaca]
MPALLPLPSDDSCMGTHVPVPRSGYTPLRWDPEQPGARARVRAYTCDCQPTYYELCQAGGLLFIRRTRRSGREIQVDEGARLRQSEAMIMWTRLLEGLVR